MRLRKQKEATTGSVVQADNTLHTHCLRCGRKLRSIEARMRGYGPICEQKVNTDVTRRLF